VQTLILLTLLAAPYQPQPTASGILAFAAIAPQQTPVESQPAEQSPEEKPAPKPPVTTCLVFTMENCPHCTTQKRIIDREMLPVGWKPSDFRYVDRDEHSDETRKFKIKSWPTIVIVKDDAEQKRFRPGYVRAKLLSEAINQVRKNEPVTISGDEPEEIPDVYISGRRFRR